MKVRQFHFQLQTKITDDFYFLCQQDKFDLTTKLLNAQGVLLLCQKHEATKSVVEDVFLLVK